MKVEDTNLYFNPAHVVYVRRIDNGVDVKLVTGERYARSMGMNTIVTILNKILDADADIAKVGIEIRRADRFIFLDAVRFWARTDDGFYLSCPVSFSLVEDAATSSKVLFTIVDNVIVPIEDRWERDDAPEKPL
jgi:hypothetical protein